MEHLIIVIYCTIQEVPRSLVKSRCILRILFVKKAIHFLFICRITEDSCNTQMLCRINFHLAFELLIIQFCHRNRSYCKYGIKSTKSLRPFDFFNCTSLSRRNLLYIRQSIVYVCLVTPIGLLIKMI